MNGKPVYRVTLTRALSFALKVPDEAFISSEYRPGFFGSFSLSVLAPFFALPEAFATTLAPFFTFTVTVAAMVEA